MTIFLQAKVCDFVIDCPAEDDEITCPAYEVFDECDSLESCHWKEEKMDHLDFVIMSIASLNEGDYIHGPHTDPLNTTDGKLVFLLNDDPDVIDHTTDQASMISPLHRNSMPSCVFEFWYYIAGEF